jgi:tetratricopeptide (TPR) repeat protein
VSGWEVTSLDELERLPVDEEGLVWRPVRRRLGITSFGTNAYTAAKAGDRVVESHTERTNGHEELYVVLAGRARFEIGEEEADAPAGTLVFLRDPAVRRGAVAVEDGTTVLAIGAKPGVAFEPSAWETAFAAYSYRRLGDVERGWSVLREAVEQDPSAWQAQYHLACFSALDGDRAAAIEHLRAAVAIDPEAARWAADDEDFDSIRDDPAFASAVAGKVEPGGTDT